MRTISDLGWAALAFEHTRNKLPAAMDRDFGAALTKAGATGKNGAYSSIFMLMPYLEEAVLFNNVHTNTGRLVQGPFSVGTTPGATAGGAWAGPDCAAPHAAHLVMPLLRCPSGGGLFHVSTTVYAGGVRTSVTATDVSCSGTACGATSYHALVGANVSSGTVAEEHAGAIVLNPVSSRGATVGLTGVTIDKVTDGTAHTILFIESRERTYASWIDGCQTWTTVATGTAFPANTTNRRWNVNVRTVPIGAPNFMSAADSGGRLALARDYGPSSEHPGGAIMAVFADSHAQAIMPDSDPSVFAAWATRAGNEQMGR
jgi:hypothetical protein